MLTDWLIQFALFTHVKLSKILINHSKIYLRSNTHIETHSYMLKMNNTMDFSNFVHKLNLKHIIQHLKCGEICIVYRLMRTTRLNKI